MLTLEQTCKGLDSRKAIKQYHTSCGKEIISHNKNCLIFLMVDLHCKIFFDTVLRHTSLKKNVCGLLLQHNYLSPFPPNKKSIKLLKNSINYNYNVKAFKGRG